MEIQDLDTIAYSCDLSQDIFIVYVPIDSSTHYQAFYTVWLYNQTPTLMPACREAFFTIWLWWLLVWPGWGVNQWPVAWEAYTLTTMPFQRILVKVQLLIGMGNDISACYPQKVSCLCLFVAGRGVSYISECSGYCVTGYTVPSS